MHVVQPESGGIIPRFTNDCHHLVRNVIVSFADQIWIRSNAILTKNCGRRWKNVTSKEWLVETNQLMNV